MYPIAAAADPVRPPRRILDAPRYVAMEQCFDRVGPAGRSGMCSTAAVQVCLDAGEAADVAARWAALHALGPVLVAAFANSPRLHGRATGWKSTRMACWLSLDPWRTAPPVNLDADPAAAWARRAMHTQLLCIRRNGTGWDAPAGVTFADWVRGALPVPPTTDDLDYHLSTLFPPVRPHGHLEVRYVDAQRGTGWELPLALLASLLANPSTVDAVLAACAPAIGRWTDAARFALADRTLAHCAATVFDLACAGLPAVGAPQGVVARLEEMTERYVLRGRCPADDDPAPGHSTNAGQDAPLLTQFDAQFDASEVAR
jgi:glutamate--cysteine ligase